jgi:uncharacterized membrane protein
MKKTKFWWMAGASTVGLVASFIQLLDKLSLLKNPHAALSCNLNSVFSCNNVLNAWQSSVFGFPNPVIGIAMFTFFLTISAVYLTGSQIARTFELVIQGLAVFMLGFTLWLFYENTYSTRAICIFCLLNGTAVLFINAVMLRHNYDQKLKRWIARGADLFGWTLLWLAVALLMILKFA